MFDQISWLGKKEELEFQKIKFSGKAAGTSWKYSQSVDGLIITRAVIFAMALLVFYPILSNYLFHDVFLADLLIERLVFSFIFIIAGVLFNRYRVLSIVLATLPILLMLITHVFLVEHINIYSIGFVVAVLFLVLRGLHYNKRVKQLREELEGQMLENQLVE